jgi:tetratricopeptide (TPR) repeat protein
VSKRSNAENKNFVKVDKALAEEMSQFLFALGIQFTNIKNADGAFNCFKYSVDMDPKNQPAVYNLGTLYHVTGNTSGAHRLYKEASRMKPSDIIARIAWAEMSRKLGLMDEAKGVLEAAYKLDPENYAVLSAIAILCYDCGQLAEAMEWNDRALEKRPSDIHMILNRTLINMTYGRWSDHWHEYEFCLSYNKNERMRGLSMASAWAGQEMEGQTIIVVSDQGAGDAIQFSRYLSEVKSRGKFSKLLYLVQPELKDLMIRVDGVDEVIGFGERLKVDYDTYSSLLGVMRVLKISPDDCNRPPHIVTWPELDRVWEAKINAKWDGQSKKVGIVWAGDPKHGNDHARSIPLTQFLKFLYGFGDFEAIQNVQLFSFQVGPALKQLTAAPVDDSWEIVELGLDFRTFDDTASALKQMDLLITCDTSMAHLAGCMGIPCWVLVPNPPEWRWMTGPGTTPWYDGVKLYRQTTPRDWDSVFNAVLRDLMMFAQQEVQHGGASDKRQQ